VLTIVAPEPGASDRPLSMLYEVVPACHGQNPLVKSERSRVLERRPIYSATLNVGAHPRWCPTRVSLAPLCEDRRPTRRIV